MKRVLYLDDSLMALRMMERMLKDLVEVLSALSVKDAEAILAIETVDMIITDYMLDDGNGIDFTRRLRADETVKDIPILLVSASLTDEVAYLGMRAGVNQSFPKPLRPAAVREAIAGQLDSPWIEDVHRSQLHARGVAWNQAGLCYEYSPDLHQRFEGRSKEEAHREMTQRLEALIGGRMEFEEVPDLEIVDYFLEVK